MDKNIKDFTKHPYYKKALEKAQESCLKEGYDGAKAKEYIEDFVQGYLESIDKRENCQKELEAGVSYEQVEKKYGKDYAWCSYVMLHCAEIAEASHESAEGMSEKELRQKYDKMIADAVVCIHWEKYCPDNLMDTEEAKIIIREDDEKHFQSREALLTYIFDNKYKLNLPRTLSKEFVLWVVANHRCKGTKCEDCDNVDDYVFPDHPYLGERCNYCANNPNVKLQSYYTKVVPSEGKIKIHQ